MDLLRKDVISIEKENLLVSRRKEVIGFLESECDRKRMQKEEIEEREKIQKEVQNEEFLERLRTDECLKLFENLTFNQFSSMKSKI